METINSDVVAAVSPKQALRQNAETLLSGKVIISKESLASMPPTLVLKMLHELQVHQVELEMQNETLRQTQLQLIAMKARYFDLYDLAPISYCTVNAMGIILEANLATGVLLGEARSKLVGQCISRFISKEYQDVYYLNRKLLLSTDELQSCELQLVRTDDSAFWVKASITSVKVGNGDTLQRMVLTDISDAKVLALALHKSEARLRAIVDSQA